VSHHLSFPEVRTAVRSCAGTGGAPASHSSCDVACNLDSYRHVMSAKAT